jgi:hypothetical protein
MSLRLIAWLPVVLAVACKGPEVSSRSPLTDDETGTSDARMVGVWQVFLDDEPNDKKVPATLVHIVNGDGAQLGVALLGGRKVGPWHTWIGAVSGQVGGRWYLSVQGRAEENVWAGIEDFLIFRCDFENDDTIHLRQLGRKRAQAAVDRGELRGRPFGSDRLRLTSSTNELAAWVAGQDSADLFEPSLLFRRVSLPVRFPDEARKN